MAGSILAPGVRATCHARLPLQYVTSMRGSVCDGKGPSAKSSRIRVACTAFSPEQLFFASNCVMIPVYGLLVAAPRSSVLFRALTSHAVPFVLGLGYLAAIVGAGMEVTSLRAALQSVVETWYSGVATMSEMLVKQWFTSVVWLNLLMLDFLMAREVALDAAERTIFAAHSIILCFMCGPVGFLSHLITKKLIGKPDLEPAVP